MTNSGTSIRKLMEFWSRILHVDQSKMVGSSFVFIVCSQNHTGIDKAVNDEKSRASKSYLTLMLNAALLKKQQMKVKL